MRTAIRYWGVLGTIGLTELLAHFLSLGWGLMTLLAAFAWVALSGASTAAKARSTEDRLAAVIPVVGTAISTANSASTLAGNALPKSGGTVTGSLTVSGSHTAGSLFVSGNATTNGSHQINGNATVNGNISGGTDVSASNNLNAGNNLNGGAAVVGNLYVGGNHVAIPQGRGTGLLGAPGSYTSAWGNSVVSFCTQVNNALQSAGIFT
jgi:hypothetical protein